MTCGRSRSVSTQLRALAITAAATGALAIVAELTGWRWAPTLGLFAL